MTISESEFFESIIEIETEIANILLENKPEDWEDISLSASYSQRPDGGDSINYIFFNSKKRPLIPGPPEVIFEKISFHRDKFGEYKKPWKELFIDIFWSDNDQCWCSEKKYKYEDT